MKLRIRFVDQVEIKGLKFEEHRLQLLRYFRERLVGDRNQWFVVSDDCHGSSEGIVVEFIHTKYDCQEFLFYLSIVFFCFSKSR